MLGHDPDHAIRRRAQSGHPSFEPRDLADDSASDAARCPDPHHPDMNNNMGQQELVAQNVRRLEACADGLVISVCRLWLCRSKALSETQRAVQDAVLGCLAGLAVRARLRLAGPVNDKPRRHGRLQDTDGLVAATVCCDLC